MRRKLILIILLISFILPGTATSALLYSNGETWNGFSKSEKEAYLYGLFDGMAVARQLIAMRLEDPACRDSSDFAYVISFHKFISPPSNETVLAELNKFYTTKENQSVRVSHAFVIVTHKLYGIPDHILEEMLLNARSSMESSEEAYKNGETQLPIEKR